MADGTFDVRYQREDGTHEVTCSGLSERSVLALIRRTLRSEGQILITSLRPSR